MRNEQIVRAWKDEEYRLSLTEAERSLLPEHPAGIVELPDDALDGVGGATTQVTPAIIAANVAITLAMSCFLICGSAKGTCEVGTAGCCG